MLENVLKCFVQFWHILRGRPLNRTVFSICVKRKKRLTHPPTPNSDHSRPKKSVHECSDLGVGGWVSCNPNVLNVVQICKSVRNIGRSPTILLAEISAKTRYNHPWRISIILSVNCPFCTICYIFAGKTCDVLAPLSTLEQ